MGRNPALFRSLPLPSLSGWEFNCYHLYLQEVHREGLMRKLCVYILVAITVKQETPPYLTLSRTMCMCTYMFPFYLWFTLALVCMYSTNRVVELLRASGTGWTKKAWAGVTGKRWMCSLLFLCLLFVCSVEVSVTSDSPSPFVSLRGVLIQPVYHPLAYAPP